MKYANEWESVKLGDTLIIGSGRDYKHLSEGDIPVFGTGGYMTSVDDFLYEGESVCIGRKGTINKPLYFDGKFWTVDTLFYSHSFKNVSPKFIYYIFQQINWLKYNEASGVPSLSKSTIEGIEIHIPKLEEQNKISTFLSLIDKRIQTQNKIIQNLELYFKGIKDNIFTQKIRFKEFTDEWEIKKMGEIGITYNGLTGKTKEDFGSGKNYVQYKQIFDESKIEITNCGLVNIDDNENQNQVKYGDIFFTISSETPQEIGMSSVLLNEVENMYLNSFCFGFRIHSFKVLLPEFARFLFRSKSFRKLIVKLAQGSTRYNMSKTELLKLLVQLPSFEEQTKIASFLSSIDEKIQTEKEILKQLESQKKYLLQNMFV